MVIGLGIGGSTLASARTEGFPCDNPVASGDGHSVSVTCYGGSNFRISAQFCGTSSCQWTTSGWYAPGQTATLSSGGYYSGQWSYTLA